MLQQFTISSPRFLLKLVLAGMLTVFLCAKPASAQLTDHNPVVQFSGIVAAGDSLYGLPGVHIINKNSRRGGTSGDKGYFSIAALEGDSILFSFVGFKSRYVRIPMDCEENKLTLIIELQIDTTQLDEIEVLPYPTKQMFKEAFVKLELPDDPLYSNMNKNLNQKRLRRMMNEMAMTADMNYKNYTLEQIKQYEQPNFVATTQLVNPMAWFALIKAIKDGKFKKPREEDYDD